MSAWRVPSPERGQLLVVTVDALVAGVHFPPRTAPEDVAWKALAVNLSDLAACASQPLAAQLEWSNPSPGDVWCQRFQHALAAAGERFGVRIHAGRPRAGERRICVQAYGQAPADTALRRDGARPGEMLWVSGTLGDAGAGLAIEQGRLRAPPGPAARELLARLRRPQPRVALGIALRRLATAAIDLSDGLAGDAAHIARRSASRLIIDEAALPISAALRDSVPAEDATRLALTAGDDYELLFSAPRSRSVQLRAAAAEAGVAITRIGRVAPGRGVVLRAADGRETRAGGAFQHFARVR